MKYKHIIHVTALLILVLFPGNIWGQEEKIGPEGKSDISLFLGASSNSEETAFTIGVDYQYRISRVFGVGEFWIMPRGTSSLLWLHPPYSCT